MKYFKQGLSPDLKLACIMFLLIFTNGCALLSGNLNDDQELLDSRIRAFNFAFEAKHAERSMVFINPDVRERFLVTMPEVMDRITVYESTLINIMLYKNELPALITENGPEKGFNRAVVTIRYRVAISPSTKLKTLMVDQEWTRQGNNWFVDPNLKAFEY